MICGRTKTSTVAQHAVEYVASISHAMESLNWDGVDKLAQEISACFLEKRQVFICGNGITANSSNWNVSMNFGRSTAQNEAERCPEVV